MGSLRRWEIFAILLLAVGGCVALARRIGENMFRGFWTQSFWLLVDVLLTSFILEALLSRDLEQRRIRENYFAFQTFTAATLNALAAMTNRETDSTRDSVMRAAILEPAEFATRVELLTNELNAATDLVPCEYYRLYLQVGSELRNLANGYVRVFSRSRKEMIETYGSLIELSLRWVYRDEFRRRHLVELEALPEEDPERAIQLAEITESKAEALDLVKVTARCLTDMAIRATRGKASLRP